jgi:hypothetical protein
VQSGGGVTTEADCRVFAVPVTVLGIGELVFDRSGKVGPSLGALVARWGFKLSVPELPTVLYCYWNRLLYWRIFVCVICACGLIL